MSKDKPPAKARSKREARPESNAGARKAAGAKPAPDGRRDAATGRFQAGNRFWEARASSGPVPKFADGEALWKACVEYFCWVEDNPLYEVHLVTFQGRTTHVPVAKMRAMSKRDLCRFLGIQRTTWNAWKRDRADLDLTIEHVESVIWCWKFDGAAAGLLNANLIARELGLADKTELAGEGGGPIKTEDVTPQRPSDERLREILAPFGVGRAENDARDARDAEQSRREKFGRAP